MSCKFAILLLVAFVGYQSVSATLHLNGKPIKDGKKHISLFEPLDHPVTFVGKLLYLRPIKFLRNLLFFPLFVVLKIVRFVLTPIRILLLPVHLIHRCLHHLFHPVRIIGRFIMNVLLTLPVIRVVTRAIIGVWRLITFPVRAANGAFRLVLGHKRI